MWELQGVGFVNKNKFIGSKGGGRHPAMKSWEGGRGLQISLWPSCRSVLHNSVQQRDGMGKVPRKDAKWIKDPEDKASKDALKDRVACSGLGNPWRFWW